MTPTAILNDDFIDTQAERLIDIARDASPHRFVLGITGLPGSGKSTLAQQLHNRIEHHAPGLSCVIPMDGFHLPNKTLDERQLRDRKGAPETFDAQGYVGLLSRARDASVALAFPIYDRKRHEPILTGLDEHRITPRTRMLITEGNYLLLNDEPWHRIHPLLDEAWWLEVPPEVCRQRLIDRHQLGGRTREEAVRHFERSDAENMRILEGCEARAGMIVQSEVTQ